MSNKTVKASPKAFPQPLRDFIVSINFRTLKSAESGLNMGFSSSLEGVGTNAYDSEALDRGTSVNSPSECLCCSRKLCCGSLGLSSSDGIEGARNGIGIMMSENSVLDRANDSGRLPYFRS